MSVDLNWETLTKGPDGDQLALQIRDFIHAKFQAVTLPRFLKSVTVHDFEFGTVPPELELKDITDPLPDFYEDDGDDIGSSSGEEDAVAEEELLMMTRSMELKRKERDREIMEGDSGKGAVPPRLKTGEGARGGGGGGGFGDVGSPLFLGVGTPGIMGGANLHYFQSHIGGSQTPLAAVVGSGWQSSSNLMSPPLPRQSEEPTPSHSRNPSMSSSVISDQEPEFKLKPPSILREKSSVSTLAPTASAGPSRPPTRDRMGDTAIEEESDEDEAPKTRQQQQRRFREPTVEDVQAVFRIRYAGDVRLRLTAEILFDHPMPSFVGIPVKLNITGLTFDGVGVLAKIRKRVHFCFLSPEDALVAVGAATTGATGETDGKGSGSRRPSAAGGEDGDGKKGAKFGGLLQEIKVESEIGQRDAGKQSLKNVGKVERFVLEQVRRIFEDEFVYPSFWTFLI
jgi:distribution and morphology protein 12